MSLWSIWSFWWRVRWCFDSDQVLEANFLVASCCKISVSLPWRQSLCSTRQPSCLLIYLLSKHRFMFLFCSFPSLCISWYWIPNSLPPCSEESLATEFVLLVKDLKDQDKIKKNLPNFPKILSPYHDHEFQSLICCITERKYFNWDIDLFPPPSLWSVT